MNRSTIDSKVNKVLRERWQIIRDYRVIRIHLNERFVKIKYRSKVLKLIELKMKFLIDSDYRRHQNLVDWKYGPQYMLIMKKLVAIRFQVINLNFFFDENETSARMKATTIA